MHSLLRNMPGEVSKRRWLEDIAVFSRLAKKLYFAKCNAMRRSNVVERALGLNTLGHAQETLIDVALTNDER